jgi:ketosteroid isomerase-like protein
MKSEASGRGSGPDGGTDSLDEPPQPGSLEGAVERWIDAWNWRQTDELVELAHPDIELHPLRLRGLSPVYNGHDGLRAWMETITRESHDHRISADTVKRIGDGRVLAIGTVSIGGHTTSPFSGVYELEDGKLLLMAHYFTPVSVLESIGVLEPGTADG